MGKSDKKIKSDRINALRKQYDSFLEDDKKRKERNEYILEKLDKMRYCTTMVQVRQKGPFFIDNRKVSLYNMPEQALDSSSGLPINLETPRARVEETDLLQEISKKFILIPKIRPTYGNDYTTQIKPKIDGHADWKSKYEILNQLKREEKESDCSMQQDSRVVESNQDNTPKNYFKENDLTQDDVPLLEYKNELPVKLTPDDQIPYELEQYTKDSSIIDKKYHHANPVENKNSHDLVAVYSDNNLKNNVYDENKMFNDTYDVNDNQNKAYNESDIQNTANYYDSTVINQPSNVTTEYLKTQEIINCQNDNEYSRNEENTSASVKVVKSIKSTNEDPSGDIYLQTINQNLYDQEDSIKIATDTLDYDGFVPKGEENNNIVDLNNQLSLNQDTSVNEMNNFEMTNEINNDASPANNATTLGPDTEYPIETVDVQDFTPLDGVQLVEGININPEPQTLVVNDDITNQYDPAVDPQNINISGETFQTQNSEEIHTEPQENYDYTEENVTENYNTEYSAPTENYQQNEEFAYYEGAQPEQPYTEINENEEITQQYDQSYEQQYGTEYDAQAYEQQGYDQEYAQGYDQQGYENPQQQYDAEQDMQYQNQDNLTPQYVEQQLDHEEGYTNETTAESNAAVESQQTPNQTDQEAKVQ